MKTPCHRTRDRVELHRLRSQHSLPPVWLAGSCRARRHVPALVSPPTGYRGHSVIPYASQPDASRAPEVRLLTACCTPRSSRHPNRLGSSVRFPCRRRRHAAHSRSRRASLKRGARQQIGSTTRIAPNMLPRQCGGGDNKHCSRDGSPPLSPNSLSGDCRGLWWNFECPSNACRCSLVAIRRQSESVESASRVLHAAWSRPAVWSSGRSEHSPEKGVGRCFALSALIAAEIEL